MDTFTLQPRQWYAFELTLPGGDRHYSPIYCYEVRPRKNGKGWLDLDFFHLNYAEGANHKVYYLRILDRGPGYLLAVHPMAGSNGAILITELTEQWMKIHFNELLRDHPAELSLSEFLAKKFPGAIHVRG